jgi:hypothetical protein
LLAVWCGLFIAVSNATAQSVRFNRSYIPLGNNPSIIYNINLTDTVYQCIGVTNYQYPQGLLLFSLDSQGEIIQAKVVGDIYSAIENGYDEHTVESGNNLMSSITNNNYNYSPPQNELVLYYINDCDTIKTTKIYADTMPCSIIL